MERFENDHVRTKEHIKELYRYAYFKRPVYVTIIVILGVAAFLNIVQAIWYGEYSFYVIFYALLYFGLQIFLYKRSVSAIWKRDREQFGPEPVKIHTEVSDEGIQCTYAETVHPPVALSSIKRVWQTKNQIALISKANLLYIIDKNGFTVGNYKEFLEYLRSRGLKVK